jgi:hypothetical protein
MAISYLSEVVKGSDYIEPYDKDVVHKAFLYQQQQFDTNVAKVQQDIDQIAGIDVYTKQDKDYRDALLQGLTNEANSMSGLDFTKSSVLNRIAQAKKAVTTDERLINAVQDTAAIRAKQKHQEELMKKGKYSDANMWFDSKADRAYLEGKAIDPNTRYGGSSTATEYKDTGKKLQEVSMKVAALKAKAGSMIPVTRNVLNPETGKYDVVHEMKAVSGISDEELGAHVMATLSPDEQRQISIDARYSYKDMPVEQLLVSATNATYNSYKGLKDRQKQLDIAANQSVKGSAEQKRYMEESASLSKMYDESIKNSAKNLGDMAKNNPDALREMLHKNQLTASYGSLYSNRSEKITEDKPYYTEKLKQLNESKFLHQQDVDAFNQGAKLADLTLKERQVAVAEGRLANDINDDNADNNRADLKQANGTGGNGTGGSKGSGSTPPIPAGVQSETVTDNDRKVQTYSDFKAEGIKLKEQEMGAVLHTLTNIAHEKDSAIFQDPELVKYLGIGEGNDIKFTDANGKINPKIANKLGKYFDEIGISGIVPKMQKYYEEIAKGGHPDAYATFKEYMPLANALADVKDKQRALEVRDREISRGAIDVLHKQVGSKLTKEGFTRNVNLITSVTAKIGAYNPTPQETAKVAALYGNREDQIKHLLMVGRTGALTSDYESLSAEGAKRIGITEKQRLEYNKQVDYYGKDIVQKFALSKDEYLKTSGSGFTKQMTFGVPESESKKDTKTSSLIMITLSSNPDALNVVVAGEKAPLKSTDARIANMSGVKLLDHTVSINGNSTARVEISYNYNDDGKEKTGKYVAKMNLSNDILENGDFRNGSFRRNEFQDVIDTIQVNGGRSSERYINYKSPNVNNPDPIAFVFEKAPNDVNDSNMYMRVVVNDDKGNDIGFRYGGRSTPDELVKKLNSSLSTLMSKGLSKAEAIEALKKAQS